MFYLDRSLNFYIIESAPSKNIAKIEKCFKKLNEVQEKYPVDSTPVVSLLNLIADLARVERSLLFDDVEGMLNAISQVNFTSDKRDRKDAPPQTAQESKPEEETITLQEYHYKLVAQLVNTELCDLPNAIKITSEQPFKDVEGILEARIKFLNRDPQKDRQEKAGKELMQELTNGSFFGEVKPDGSDGFRDGVFAAMGMKPPASQPNNDDDQMPDSVKKALGL